MLALVTFQHTFVDDLLTTSVVFFVADKLRSALTNELSPSGGDVSKQLDNKKVIPEF